jgi:outer membrane protein assembly factor BamA
MVCRIHGIMLMLLFSSMILQAQNVKEEKNLKVAAIPMITYNRTQDFCLGAIVSGYYKVHKKDTISPSSSSGIIGMYTMEKSHFFLAFQQFYLAKDRWRIKAGVGDVNINFQFYYEDPSVSVGDFVDYSTKANFATVQVQRHIIRRLYAGLTGAYIGSETKFILDETLGRDSIKTSSLNNIGYIISNDSRNNVNYPSKGMFLNFKNQFYREWTGSDYGFTRFMINYNQFFRLTQGDTKILAVRAACNISTGDVPFEAQTVVGNDDIRGYSQGRYRGDQVYTLQAEYRWSFHKRFGMVGFAGIASAVDHFKEVFETSLLPGIGAGLRFRMIPSEKINIGIDAALGKDDYSITFRIGEAFAR